MYAVIETGGKQYRGSPGQTVEVELLPDTPGARIALDRVLLVSAEGKMLVGQPTIPGAKVLATVAREGRGEKIIVFKYKSKKRYRRTKGHRQDYSYLLVTDIQADGASLLTAEERTRYQRLAQRATSRYEARLAAAIADLAVAEAVGDEAAMAADEAEIEEADGAVSIPDEEIEAEASEPPKKKKGK